MQEHTVRSYGEDLRRLKETIARMGGLAERQVADAAMALVRRDTDLAAEVVDEPGDTEADKEDGLAGSDNGGEDIVDMSMPR